MFKKIVYIHVVVVKTVKVHAVLVKVHVVYTKVNANCVKVKHFLL